MIHTFQDIAQSIPHQSARIIQDVNITELITDSRRMIQPESSLFFAIDGPNRKGIDFVEELYAGGVKSFVIPAKYRQSIDDSISDANILFVDDIVLALQQTASFHRKHFQYPVIGITGSNGKTIIKEWLYQLLSNMFHIVRSPKSYNSQIGVPLSIWEMNEHDELGIFEAGISIPGEMERLQMVINPDIGVLGFMGDAHAEGFQSHQHKIAEKLLLFKNAQLLIYNKDDQQVDQAVHSFKHQHPSLKLFSWGRSSASNLILKEVKINNSTTDIHAVWQKGDIHFSIPFTDEAAIFNAVTCIVVMINLQVPHNIIGENTMSLRPVAMRLEMKPGLNQCSIINDSYNNDIDSLRIALDFLSQQVLHSRKTLILSDIFQSSIDKATLYQHVASLAAKKGVQKIIGIGAEISQHRNSFNAIPEAFFYSDTATCIQHFEDLQFRNETILLKGSRSFAFETISKMLEQQQHDTRLEINLNALRSNIKTYRSLLKPGVKMMAMVKAFGYGSGSHEIANLLQHEGMEYLAVAYADEGVQLRKEMVKLPIMVMNPNPDDFDNLIQHQLEPELYSFRVLYAFANYLKSKNIHQFPVHIKLDTGMHRLGFMEQELPALINSLQQHAALRVQSVFSHLVASEDSSQDDYTQHQAVRFEKMTVDIEHSLGYSFLKHLSNTSAIHRHPSLQMDMVRLGIGMYGVDAQLSLQTVTTLRSSITQIKQLRKGDTVGYGRKGVLTKDSMIATVRIGYADGYPRALSNGKGKMLVNGQWAEVVGNVCMDMTMIDVTGIAVKEGDEVIIFGNQPSVSELATWAATIPYEILTGIAQRVKRVYFEE